MKKELNIFLSGFWLGIIVTIVSCILLMMCATGCSSDIAPKYKGVVTKTGSIIEINPNTMRVWETPKGALIGKSTQIDSIAYDGRDSAGNINQAFVTAFKGQKPVATIFRNVAFKP